MSQPAEQRGRLFALLPRQSASDGDGTAQHLFSVSATELTFCDRLSLSSTLAIFPGNKRDPTNPLRAMWRKASPVTAPRQAKRLHGPLDIHQTCAKTWADAQTHSTRTLARPDFPVGCSAVLGRLFKGKLRAKKKKKEKEKEND